MILINNIIVTSREWINSLEVVLTLIYDDYSKMRIHYVQTYFMNANGAREMKMDEVLILYIVRRTDH